MSSDYNLDFEVPYYIIEHYYISGGVSVFFNFLVLYLLLFHSGKIGNFKFCLLSFQVSSIILDLIMTLFMQPIGLFPICAGYSYGILSRWYSWSSHLLMMMVAFFLSCQIETLMLCILQKHKTILGLRKLSNIPDWPYNCVFVVLGFYPFLVTFTLDLSSENHERQLELLNELYPALVDKFRSLPEFQYYVINDGMKMFLALALFGTVQAFVVETTLVIHMYRTLKSVQNQLSSITMGRHKSALRSLVAQFATTPVAMLPGGIVALCVVFPTDYSQKITWYSIMVMTTHSTLNAIVMILTYPQFKKNLMFWNKNMKRTSIATI
ncbi:Serpentine Receptor, class H [Caenorhabditis elegans]|uniref:Serpentine Receptor, class H n=1 Tax=Caenorhabditis elegans TaxID=6239 RepID=O17663_CAEEL|nr:Serpentine Receptor, class H [Caenorhabditis elegans]CAB02835.3 Serpentine Receptor, class H [Caenorhabditis elegans]|eukprot:NP_506758.2 Serpentine Receptor, class I [Caenorhabditis elegans]